MLLSSHGTPSIITPPDMQEPHKNVQFMNHKVISWMPFPNYWPLCVGNPPVTGGFPTQRASNVDPWYNVFTVAWIGFWTNNQEAGELKRPKYYVPSLLCIQEQNSSISEWLPKCSKEVHLWFLSQSGEYMKLNILSRFCRGGIQMIFCKICWGGITKTFHETLLNFGMLTITIKS